MARTPRIAPKVFERDGYACVFCGDELGDEGVEFGIDHVIPRAWFERGVATGDMDDRTNLATCCHNCNSLKRDLNLNLYAAYLVAGHGWSAEDARSMVVRVRAALRRRLPR